MMKIPIVLSTDENYAPYCSTVIASILKNSKKETELSFYILTAGLSNEIKEKFEELKKIKNCSIDFVILNKDLFKNCPITNHFSIAAYFRFKLASMFPLIDKILYFDCDIMVLDDLTDLFNTDVENYYAGMVLDASMKNASNDNIRRLNIPENSSYFNTGLVIANLKKWRDDKIEEKLFEWTNKNKEKIMWVDQDVMNAVFTDLIKELPEKYNIQLNYYDNAEKVSKLNEEEIANVHYCGSIKPWNDKDIVLSEFFWKYAKYNPFYEIICEKYLSRYSEMQTSEVDFIKYLISENKPKKLLEIGIAAGSCSAFMLNEIKHEKDAMVYGIDYGETYYRDGSKKTGWIIEETYPELTDKMKIFTGGVAACFLDNIGKGIDFCVIDTQHVLPGELIDFLMVLPYMNENAICILHDTNMQNLPIQGGAIRVSKDADTNNLEYHGDAYATGILMDSLASEKIFPKDYLLDFALPNIVAFRITADLKKYIQNVFYALTLPWKYKLTLEDQEIIKCFFERHYSREDAEYFNKVANLMHARIDNENKKNEEKKNEEKKNEIFYTQSQLDESKKEIERLYASREWKLILKLQRIFKIIFPSGSSRRKTLVKLFRFTKRIVKIIFKTKRKIFEVFLLSKNYLMKFKPKKKRKINLKSKKLVYIGHSYHNKTKSTVFLIDYLKEFFEVEVISDESWNGGPAPDLSFIDESYLGVIFFQLLPSKEIIESIKNDNIIYFPMHDQSGRLSYNYWSNYRDLKIINFSSTLHEKLKKWGFESMSVQYFPDLQKFIPGKKDEVFFWQRLTKIAISTIIKLLNKERVKIHIHKAIDPDQEFISPQKEDEEKFQITYSDWFETREEMWDVIKQKGVYVAPREYEGIGLSFLEAMSMGKAVVAVNNPTMNEYIEHGKNGYLYDLDNPKEIDLSNIEQVQKNTHQYMQEGYKKWNIDKKKIIEFIKK